jgi:arylsulfatase A-like enzyme
MKAKTLSLLMLCIIILAGLAYVAFHFRSKFSFEIPENILLITVDTLRADHLGYHGYPRATSPFLDRFSQRSVVFTDASAQIPKTLPSMASMMTSRYPERIGVLANFHVLQEGLPTLAEILGRRGFLTLAYTTNGNLIAERGISRGFDEFSFRPRRAEGLADTVVDRFGHDPPGKFFAWVHFNDPHGPYRPAGAFRDLFLDDDYYDRSQRVALAYEPMPGYNQNFVLGAVPRYQQKSFREHERREERDFYIARYDGEIRSTDAQIGRLIGDLEKNGLLRNTLVVITADHGEALGEHRYYFEHGWFLYQHQVHVPLLIRFPGQEEKRIIGTPAALTDLAPTLLDILGISPPPSFQGRSLMPLIAGRDAASLPVYAVTPDVYPRSYRSLRSGRWKYIVDDEGREELYDLAADPEERSNLIGGNAGQADRMRRMMSRAVQQAGPSGKPLALSPEALDPEVIENLRSLGYLE